MRPCRSLLVFLRESVAFGSIEDVTVTLRRLTPIEFSMLTPLLVEIYIEAMGYPREKYLDRAHAWKGETMRPGFTAVLAEDESGALGFAYGFIGSRDTWWDKQVRRGFDERGGATESQEKVMQDYFEVAEIHVLPSTQGRGIGRQLLHGLLWNQPSTFAVLSTPEVPGESNAAFHLYRSFGFFDLLRFLEYPADTRSFAILALNLHDFQRHNRA